MPRYNVHRPSDGKWACFSSVVDDYITDFMPEDEYQRWREHEYGKSAGPIKEANQMTYQKAEYARALNKCEWRKSDG